MESNKPGKPATNKVNTTEHTDNDNEKSTENLRCKFFLKTLLTKSL